ncbi:MAG: sugar transferase, partial [Steroidobacteraceae bacterium]
MVKRAFDVSLASVGLVLSSPLWAIIAAAIRLEDGGPVFFTQPRVGLGGRTFRAFKFRSMVVNA